MYSKTLNQTYFFQFTIALLFVYSVEQGVLIPLNFISQFWFYSKPYVLILSILSVVTLIMIFLSWIYSEEKAPTGANKLLGNKSCLLIF